MPANARQKSLYKHRVNVWRLVPGAIVNKKRGDGAWTLIASNVICLIGQKTNMAEAVPGAGRIEPASRRTNKEIHFVLGQDVQQGDVLVNVTLDRFGQRIAGMYGQCFTTLGLPEDVPALGARGANFRAFEIQVLEKPPEEIVT